MEQIDFLGAGLAFPIGPERASGRFAVTAAEENIRQSICIILGTRKGERLMHPDFGCDIHDFAFEVMDYQTCAQAESSVREALIAWEPRIRDIEVRAKPDDLRTGVLNLEIGYVVRATNNPFNLVYPFYLTEGMEQPF